MSISTSTGSTLFRHRLCLAPSHVLWCVGMCHLLYHRCRHISENCQPNRSLFFSLAPPSLRAHILPNDQVNLIVTNTKSERNRDRGEAVSAGSALQLCQAGALSYRRRSRKCSKWKRRENRLHAVAAVFFCTVVLPHSGGSLP